MNLNLIPFGLSEKDGKFLDVAEVAQGKQCGCICPSCKTPLIARQGQVKEWHFAHASKTHGSSTKKPCKFSFYVSVRLMARQILGENLEILLPDYQDTVSVNLDPFRGEITSRFNITAQHRITLKQIEIEQSFLGKPVDIIGHIGEFSFIIYFTHPGRKVPREFYNPPDAHCGILAISLEYLPGLFLTAKKRKISYLKILHHFLCNNLPSKHWVFHPRHAQRKKLAKDRLQQQAEVIVEQKKQRQLAQRLKREQMEAERLEKLQQQRKRQKSIDKQEEKHRHESKQGEFQKTKDLTQRQESENVNSNSNKIPKQTLETEQKAAEKTKLINQHYVPPRAKSVNESPLYPPPEKIEGIKISEEEKPKRQANYKCVLCNTKWQGPEPSDSACPKCNTHLYRQLISYVDEKLE